MEHGESGIAGEGDNTVGEDMVVTQSDPGHLNIFTYHYTEQRVGLCCTNDQMYVSESELQYICNLSLLRQFYNLDNIHTIYQILNFSFTL
jgi:hypothetical protein